MVEDLDKGRRGTGVKVRVEEIVERPLVTK